MDGFADGIASEEGSVAGLDDGYEQLDADADGVADTEIAMLRQRNWDGGVIALANYCMKGTGDSGISPTGIWVLSRLDEELMHEWRGDARIKPGDLKDLAVLMDLPYSESLGDHDDSIYLRVRCRQTAGQEGRDPEGHA